jgi:hypothetical protein
MADDTSTRLEAAKIKFPGKRLVAVDTAAGVLILRQPTRQEYLMYQSLQWGDDVAKKAGSFAELLRMTCVDPEAGAMAALIEDWPGIASDPEVVEALKELAGSSKKKRT